MKTKKDPQCNIHSNESEEECDPNPQPETYDRTEEEMIRKDPEVYPKEKYRDPKVNPDIQR